MESVIELKKLINRAQTSGIASEDDVRLKFVDGLLKWLGFPDSCIGTGFPVYFSEGRKKNIKHADYILFSERGQDLHRNETREDVDWVKDHSLLVVEAKRPGEIPELFGQPQFYCMWTSAPAYILTDSISIFGFLPEQFSADCCLLNCRVEELCDNGAIRSFSYDGLKNLKKGEVRKKDYIEKIAANIAPFPREVKYIPVEKYIPRKVRRIAGKSPLDGELNMPAVPLSLLDANKTDKQIILLGGAGTGKSKELQQLAYLCSQRKDWIPVLRQLRDYVSDDRIEDIIAETTGQEYCSNSILLLDAFDEIDESCASMFLRRLNRYVEKYPDQHIILTTRYNFYHSSAGKGYEGALHRFEEYELSPLDEEDIRSYLATERIDEEVFLKEVADRNLTELIQTPFYLHHTVELFRKENKLPDPGELMEKLVLRSIRFDDQKFAVAHSRINGQATVFSILEKIAFLMQCLMKNAISSEEYGRLLGEKEMETLQYCSVWTQDGMGNYLFEHNNFREYLAARFLVRMPEDNVVSVITSDRYREKVKPSWQNVLAFLLRMDQSGLMRGWVLEHDPMAAAGMETDRLEDALRTAVFNRIWQDYKNRSVMLARKDPDTLKLARLGQTDTCVGNLCSELERMEHDEEKLNVLRLWQCMETFCGCRSRIRELLKKIIADPNESEFVVGDAIATLGNERLYAEEDLAWLLQIERLHRVISLRITVYSYVYEYGLQGDCMDFIIEGLDLLNNKRNISDLSFVILLEYLLSVLSTYEELHAVFDWIIKGNLDPYAIRMSRFPACMETMLDKAAALYENGCSEIAHDLIKVHISCLPHAPLKITEYTRNALKRTGLLARACHLIQSDFRGYPLLANMLRDTMDDACLEDLLENYKKESTVDEDLLTELAYSYGIHTDEYRKIRETIFEKTGKWPDPEPLSWEEKNRINQKAFFEILFDKDDFLKKLEEFLALYRGSDTTFQELAATEKLTQIRESTSGYLLMWQMLQRYVEDNETVHVRAFFEKHFCEDFSAAEIMNFLRQNKDFYPEQAQIEWIHAYTVRTLPEVDFEKEIVYGKNGIKSYSHRAIYICFFADRFDFHFDEKIYPKMLLAPQSFFADSNPDVLCFAPYLMRHLSKEQICQSILEYCEKGQAVGPLAISFIRYAREQSWPALLNMADEIIRDPESSSWGKSECILYILTQKRPGEVLRTYLEAADDEWRETLLSTCSIEELPDPDRRWLCDTLENIHRHQKAKEKYLSYLIMLNSVYGLDVYIQMAEEENGIPDYAGEHQVPHITEMISYISDTRLIDRLMKLVSLVFGEGFRDLSSFGLKHFLGRALLSMGENEPDLVLDTLNTFRRNYDPVDQISYFCGYYIDSINLINLRKHDKPLTMLEAKKLYRDMTGF